MLRVVVVDNEADFSYLVQTIPAPYENDAVTMDESDYPFSRFSIFTNSHGTGWRSIVLH